MKAQKINFKQPKYIMPLIILPFLVFIIYILSNLISPEQKQEEKLKELSTSLGEVNSEILSKNDAYDQFYELRDNRSMLDDLNEDEELYKKEFSDNLSDEQKKYIDSLEFVRKKELEKLKSLQQENNNDKTTRPCFPLQLAHLT